MMRPVPMRPIAMRGWSVPFAVTCWLATGAVTPTHGQSPEPVITSDTPAYCGVLMNRITGLTRGTAVPVEAVTLSAEGERMCEQGQVRSGILRLRRAITILRHPGD